MKHPLVRPLLFPLLFPVLLIWPVVLSAAAPPAASDNLRIKAPINSWDDAIPLGNGLMGGLLWGTGNTIRLSLDRGDLWDERTHGEKEWWKKNTWRNAAGGGDPWDQYYHGVTPTKLPGGRLEITLPATKSAAAFEMNLATAEGRAEFRDGSALSAFYSADKPVVLMRIPGEPQALDLLPAGAGKEGNAGPSSGGAVSKLGYPPPARGNEGSAKWFVQNGVDGFQYCVCIETTRAGADTLLALAITSTNDLKAMSGSVSGGVLGLARARCAAAIKAGYETMREPHAAWWSRFWEQSAVSLPEPPLQRYYQFARYLYGAGSRQGAPPIPLQGVWTADNGGLPPWKGDYHNDLNTQMTYIAYQGAGNFESGRSYLDYLTRLTPVFRSFAWDFYGTPGLSTPGVMSLGGQPLGGWGQYSLSPTMTAWNAHLFYLHWRYTGDDDFLRTHARPWCEEVGQCLAALLKPGPDGRLLLPFSSSPEIHGNTNSAWLQPNSNYDLMCMKMLFLALVEMADASGDAAAAGKWGRLAAGLGDFHAAPDGELMVDPKQLLNESHRHLSNLMAIHPFNLITTEGGDEDRRRIRASVAKWDKLGPSQWCGYSWAWMSCLRARVGDAESALRHFDVFARAFVTRNGFHVNGDQTKSGYSSMTYRPFTLEGNFIAMQAVHEMLLQSWSPTPGERDTEILRVFPATPWRWHDVSFTDLRAEGGHRVSAKRENNATTWLRVVAGRDGEVRIRDNFGGREPKWSRPVAKAGDNFTLRLRRGETVEATLTKPSAPPPAPPDLAEPVAIREASGVPSNNLPLRIGAASDGSSRFKGEMAGIVVTDKALEEDEIAALAATNPAAETAAQVVSKLGTPVSMAELGGKVFRFDGDGYLEIPAAGAPNGGSGLALAAWIKPLEIPAAGMRIIDKCPVAAAAGYLLDTHPAGSLRLITREPHLIHPAKLAAGTWTHVAATVDGKTGRRALHVNGRRVASD